MQQPRRQFLVFFIVALVCGVAFGFVLGAPFAHANFFTDLWNNIASPFVPKNASTSLSNVSSNSAVVPQPSEPVLDYEHAVIAAVKKASPAVVSIVISKDVPIIENCAGSPFSNIPPEFQQFFGDDFQFSQPCQKGTRVQEVGGGSGFIVGSDGLILTNKHVVADAKASYTVFTNDGKKYDAKVLARDPVQDLALIKVEAVGLPTVELGDSSGLELGQTAIAIGNALGEYRNTVSRGVVSGLARTVTAASPDVGQETIQGVIQTDAAINPGNSGGPLLNIYGQVIGINTTIASNAQNIGFAIPINRAKKDITSVKSSGVIETPFLGVRYIAVTPDLAKSQKLPVDYGALVRGSNSLPAVQKGSPAEAAGIKPDDIILEINGQKITQERSLSDIVNDYNVGQSVTLKVSRNGTELMLTAKLAKRSE